MRRYLLYGALAAMAMLGIGAATAPAIASSVNIAAPAVSGYDAAACPADAVMVAATANVLVLAVSTEALDSVALVVRSAVPAAEAAKNFCHNVGRVGRRSGALRSSA